MAYVDPRELSYTEEEIESGDAISGVVYNPPPPTTIVAERDDDFLSLARKLNVDVGDLVRANPETDTVSAGAAYSVPQPTPEPTPDPYADVPRAMPGETTEEFLQRINPPPPPPPGERQTFYDWASGLEGGDFGGGLQNIIPDIAEWIRNLFIPKSGVDTSGGVGTGAGIMMPSLTGKTASPAQPFPDTVQPPDPWTNRPGITPAQSRLAESFTDWWNRASAAGQAPSGIPQYSMGRTGQPGAGGFSPGYYDTGDVERVGGQLMTTPDMRDPAAGYEDWQRMAQAYGFDPTWSPSDEPNRGDYDLSQGVANQQAPLTAEEKLRQDWENIYLNPENRGRGGGVVAWIEERTGLDIDPESFFTEDRSEEVLQAMLEEFRPDELEWLEHQGILVPVEEQGALPLPGGSGALPLPGGSGGDYQYPLYYGSGDRGSGPTYRRQPILGLTSWSI